MQSDETTPNSDQSAVDGPSDALDPDDLPEVIEESSDESGGTFVSEPARLLRIASMTRAMLDEVRQAPLEEAGRTRLLDIYRSSMEQLKDSLSDDLRQELAAVFLPLEGSTVSESELRVVQAQMVGWLEGLFHGIQASIFSQQASAAAQLEEMRRRPPAIEGAIPGQGQYL